MQKHFKVAKNTAISTGKILAKRFKLSKKISYKGEVNLVTDSDIMAEKRIISALKKSFPSYEILAEETSNNYTSKKKSSYCWIIDPIDGTTNFAHGYPFFAISIGLEYKGKIVLGVVYNPILKELFHAIKGKGAYLNGKKIHVSNTKELNTSLLATGFPYDRRKTLKTNLKYFGIFQKHAQGIRRDGSAVLNLCYLACGRFDGFWELKLNPWDTAAGSIIVEEAGGKVTDFSNNKYNVYKKEILATNGKMHRQMLNILNI